MDVSEEPFTVTVNDGPPEIIITCKKVSERDETVRKLRKTFIFRKIRAGISPDVCIIPCITIKKRDRLLAMILVTMQMLRKIKK